MDQPGVSGIGNAYFDEYPLHAIGNKAGFSRDFRLVGEITNL
jgi:hypothetical protein